MPAVTVEITDAILQVQDAWPEAQFVVGGRGLGSQLRSAARGRDLRAGIRGRRGGRRPGQARGAELTPAARANPMPPTNWAGNHTYRARVIHAPSTLEQVQEIVAAAPQIRVLGSRHSFTDIADSAELVTLEHLPPDVVVDRAAMTVTCGGAVRYGELALELAREGLALANLASLPHIAVAGAVSTATHGSGDRNGNLATAVAALEIVTSDGDVLTAARGDPDFDGLVVGLGAVGAVTRVTLDVEPAYQVRQRVFEGLEWHDLFEHFDAITSSGYQRQRVHAVGRDDRPGVGQEPRRRAARGDRRGLFGAAAATQHRHPILGLDPVNCTPQLGVAGPWAERLPHFRMGFTPSSGEEIQSEYLVPRGDAVAAIEAVLGIAAAIRPVIQVSEIRTIAADALWMSPQYGRDTVAIHFTWSPEPAAVRRALAEVERVLAPFEARPHWGKLFLAGADEIRPAVRAARRFPRAAGSPRPARRVPQRLAASARPRPRLIREQLAPAELGRVPERRPRLGDVEQRVGARRRCRPPALPGTPRPSARGSAASSRCPPPR